MSVSDDVKLFEGFKKYQPTRNQIDALRYDLHAYIKIVRYFIKKYNVNTPEDLKDAFQKFICVVLNSLADNTYIDSKLYEIQAIEDLLKDYNYIQAEYAKLKDFPNSHSVYNADSARSKKLVLVNGIHQLADIEKFMKDNNITLKTISSYSTKKPESKFAIGVVKDILNQHTDYGKLTAVLEYQKHLSTEFVKSSIISSLHCFFDYFDSLGLLDYYVSLYNSSSKRFGFSELDYAVSTGSFDKNSIGLKDSFSEGFLKNLSLRELCFLSIYWSNRFTKEIASIYTSLSAIDSMGLWQYILDGQRDFKFSDDELSYSLKKTTYLSKIFSTLYQAQQSNIAEKEISQGMDFEDTYTRDFSRYFKQLHNKLQDRYVHFFEDHLFGNNIFLDNIGFLLPFMNLEQYAYGKKAMILEPSIKEALDSTHLKNWGIIRQEFHKNKFVDSLGIDKSMILLGFDIEGFNMPFRFHIKKEDLIRLAKLSHNTTMIPEYQGDEDFVIGGNVIPSNLIMPISKRHKKAIIEHANSDSAHKAFWEHIYFLMNGKFPPHLMQNITVGKNKTVSTRLPVIYTDLETGKRYISNKDSFINLDDEER